MRIIDDFLPWYELKRLRSRILGSDFPWFFNASVDHPPGHRDHDHNLLTKRQVRYAFHTDTDQQ